MKLTGQQLEEIKREVEKDLRESIIRELRHACSHSDFKERKLLEKIINHIQDGHRLWHW